MRMIVQVHWRNWLHWKWMRTSWCTYQTLLEGECRCGVTINELLCFIFISTSFIVLFCFTWRLIDIEKWIAANQTTINRIFLNLSFWLITSVSVLFYTGNLILMSLQCSSGILIQSVLLSNWYFSQQKGESGSHQLLVHGGHQPPCYSKCLLFKTKTKVHSNESV